MEETFNMNPCDTCGHAMNLHTSVGKCLVKARVCITSQPQSQVGTCALCGESADHPSGVCVGKHPRTMRQDIVTLGVLASAMGHRNFNSVMQHVMRSDVCPTPTHNKETPVYRLVFDDIQHRVDVGIEKYGTPLQPHNGRDFLVDLYQELLDALFYLRGELQEKYGDESQDIIASAGREHKKKTEDA